MTSITAAPNENRKGSPLPRCRAVTVEQAVDDRDPQGMKRMIDPLEKPLTPPAVLDLLGLRDVPKPDVRARLGVLDHPAQEQGRAVHKSRIR